LGGNESFERIAIEAIDNDLFNINLTKSGVGFIVGSNGLILRNKTITTIKQQDKNDINISIFPNPVADRVTINFNDFSEYEIKIFNNQQLLMFTSLIGAKTELNMENFSSGIYLIEIKSKDSKLTKKIIKI
jgi:hypothetical protein